MDFTLDTSELDSLAVDLGKAGRKATLSAAAVIKHAAVNIKTNMQDDISQHPHFDEVARDISFDIRGLSVEVGPVTGRGKGHQGSLAFIAAYGASSTPAFWDHTAALRKELPAIEKFLGQIGVESL